MTLEYDTRTRRFKIQISETVFRAAEKMAEESNGKKSITRILSDLCEEAAEDLVKGLTLEDELIVNERIRENIEKRMKEREKK